MQNRLITNSMHNIICTILSLFSKQIELIIKPMTKALLYFLRPIQDTKEHPLIKALLSEISI